MFVIFIFYSACIRASVIMMHLYPHSFSSLSFIILNYLMLQNIQSCSLSASKIPCKNRTINAIGPPQSDNKTKNVTFFVHIATDSSFKNAKIFWCFVDIIYLIFQTAHQEMMIKSGKAMGNEGFTKLQGLYM